MRVLPAVFKWRTFSPSPLRYSLRLSSVASPSGRGFYKKKGDLQHADPLSSTQYIQTLLGARGIFVGARINFDAVADFNEGRH